MQVTVNVVDNDSSIIEMLMSLSKRYGFRYQTFAGAEEFASTYAPTVPSITFISSDLPGDGMQRVLDRLRLGSDSSAIIMTCPGVAPSRIVQAMKAGAEDVLEKPFSGDQALAIINRLFSPPTVVVHPAHQVATNMTDQLTFEEQQILSLMEQGVAIKQIASKLDISVRTVHYRKASILEKTNCNTCTEVIAKMLAMRSHASRSTMAPAPAVFYTGGTFTGNDFQPVSD
jgi:two-component system CheB/CheR fusion protein